jgi:CBS domain-containing protein
MDRLEEIAAQVADGQRPTATVRDFVSWFGFKRRHPWAVGFIRRELRKKNLSTNPDFDWTHLDGQITFAPLDGSRLKPESTGQIGIKPEDQMEQSDSLAISLGENIDPTYRIGRLDIGKVVPVSVAPDATVEEATGLMLRHDFSQVPVMAGERSVKGIFSWRSLGSTHVWGKAVSVVREAMDRDVHQVSEDTSLFEVIEIIDRSDCVLVKDSSARIAGIITAYDITKTFAKLGEPFLVLGEIENHIRSLLEGKFSRNELIAARDPDDPDRAIDKVSDLTLGEYLRLLEKQENWGKLGLRVPRATFVKELEEIRRIRNDVMHFDPEGVDGQDLETLRAFVKFLRRIQDVRPR